MIFSEGAYLNNSCLFPALTIKIRVMLNIFKSLGEKHVTEDLTNGDLSCALVGECGGWSSG